TVGRKPQRLSGDRHGMRPCYWLASSFDVAVEIDVRAVPSVLRGRGRERPRRLVGGLVVDVDAREPEALFAGDLVEPLGEDVVGRAALLVGAREPRSAGVVT